MFHTGFKRVGDTRFQNCFKIVTYPCSALDNDTQVFDSWWSPQLVSNLSKIIWTVTQQLSSLFSILTHTFKFSLSSKMRYNYWICLLSVQLTQRSALQTGWKWKKNNKKSCTFPSVNILRLAQTKEAPSYEAAIILTSTTSLDSIHVIPISVRPSRPLGTLEQQHPQAHGHLFLYWRKPTLRYCW